MANEHDDTVDVKVKQPNDIPELLGVIRDTVKNLSDSQSEQKETNDKMEADLRSALKEVQESQKTVEARVEALTEQEELEQKNFWDEVAGEPVAKTTAPLWNYNNGGGTINNALYSPVTRWSNSGFRKTSEYIVSEEAMKMNDFLCLYGAAKSVEAHGAVVPEAYRSFISESNTYDLLNYELSRTESLRKALDTTDTASWIPTQMSAQFIDDIRLQLKVAALFPRITIPERTGSFDVPTQGSRKEAYLVGESTADTSTKIQARDAGSGKVTFTPIKHALRMLFSDELDEDSAVAIMPIVMAELQQAMADAEEIAILNGDKTDAVHFDSNVTAANDIRKSWDGLRYTGGAKAAATDIAGDAAVSVSTFGDSELNTLRKEMGVYGVNASDLSLIVGLSGYIQMLDIDNVQTLDKYGSGATILAGELGKINGIPIVVSEHVAQNLNATGNYDGSTTTKTLMLLVNRASFWIGDKGTPRSDSMRDIETQQTKVVVSRRLAFKSIRSGSAHVGTYYNITS